MKIYTLKQTLQKLSNSPNDCTPQNIASLCRTGALTPLFAYHRYISAVVDTDEYGAAIFATGAVEKFSGYLTNDYIISLLDGYNESIQLIDATPYQKDYEVILLAKPFNIRRHYSDDSYSMFSDDDPFTVALDNIVFDAEQVDRHIAANAAGDQSEPTSELLNKAQATIEEQQKQIEQLQAQTKKVPHQSYKTVDSILYAMAQLTNKDNSSPYSQNNGSLNAAITTILQNDGMPLEYEAVGKWLTRINNLKKS